MRINQNIAAFNAYRNLNQTQNALSSSLEKLSSGFRINRAADDASGLVNSENLRSQIGGLKVASRNAQDAISMVQTAEGAQTEVHSILQRMRDLTVQSGNIGTNDTNALQANQDEITELVSELNRISDQTQFGTQKILDGTFAVTAGSAATAGTASFGLTVGSQAGNNTWTVTVDGVGQTVDIADNADLATTVAALDGLTGVGATESGGTITLTSESTGSTSTVTAAITTPVASGTAAITGLTTDDGDAAVADTGGATFQVGANSGQTVTVGIDSVVSTTLGTGATGLAGGWGSVAEIDLTEGGTTAANVSDALKIIDDAISTVSTNRATLGAFQNRMESTIRNVSVAVENLSAAESRIRDTDMAQEMVSFTRNQILQQAGTAMLAQANQVPQSVLSLLR